MRLHLASSALLAALSMTPIVNASLHREESLDGSQSSFGAEDTYESDHRRLWTQIDERIEAQLGYKDSKYSGPPDVIRKTARQILEGMLSYDAEHKRWKMDQAAYNSVYNKYWDNCFGSRQKASPTKCKTWDVAYSAVMGVPELRMYYLRRHNSPAPHELVKLRELEKQWDPSGSDRWVDPKARYRSPKNHRFDPYGTRPRSLVDPSRNKILAP